MICHIYDIKSLIAILKKTTMFKTRKAKTITFNNSQEKKKSGISY